MNAILVDTNVLTYAHDRDAGLKQGQAIQTLRHLQLAGKGVLSAQCLSEFFSVTTRRKPSILTVTEAAKQVQFLATAFLVFSVTPQIVLEATRGVREHQLAYWDAQLWATARLNQIPIIFSEDFNSGSSLEGVRFVNPFVPGFAVDDWA